eukprot:1874619-Rhodomonas_salina.5
MRTRAISDSTSGRIRSVLRAGSVPICTTVLRAGRYLASVCCGTRFIGARLENISAKVLSIPELSTAHRRAYPSSVLHISKHTLVQYRTSLSTP